MKIKNFMERAIILPGMPSKEEYYNSKRDAQSNSHWIPWIQQQLIVNDILAQAVELPEPYSPDYSKWKDTFEQFTINKDTILIGHSCGAGFLVRWLSENKVNVGKVALVAPWLDPQGELDNDFFDFEIDKELLNRIKKLSLFVSEDDYDFVLESVDIIKSKLNKVEVKKFTDKGHFVLGDMKTREFPELLDFLLE